MIFYLFITVYTLNPLKQQKFDLSQKNTVGLTIQKAEIQNKLKKANVLIIKDEPKYMINIMNDKIIKSLTTILGKKIFNTECLSIDFSVQSFSSKKLKLFLNDFIEIDKIFLSFLSLIEYKIKKEKAKLWCFRQNKKNVSYYQKIYASYVLFKEINTFILATYSYIRSPFYITYDFKFRNSAKTLGKILFEINYNVSKSNFLHELIAEFYNIYDEYEKFILKLSKK